LGALATAKFSSIQQIGPQPAAGCDCTAGLRLRGACLAGRSPAEQAPGVQNNATVPECESIGGRTD